MIRFDSNKELLNYLMTSDFIDENPDELRELLALFRKFYRSTNSKFESLEYKVDRLEARIKILEFKLRESETDNKKKEEKYDSVVKRKLSIKERIKGEIYETERKRSYKIVRFFNKLFKRK